MRPCHWGRQPWQRAQRMSPNYPSNFTGTPWLGHCFASRSLPKYRSHRWCWVPAHGPGPGWGSPRPSTLGGSRQPRTEVGPVSPCAAIPPDKPEAQAPHWAGHKGLGPQQGASARSLGRPPLTPMLPMKKELTGESGEGGMRNSVRSSEGHTHTRLPGLRGLSPGTAISLLLPESAPNVLTGKEDKAGLAPGGRLEE